jgi:hypothetical protein
MLRPKGEEITKERRKLRNEELHSLKTSQNVVRAMKSSRIRWVVHVERMGPMRSAYKILVGQLSGTALVYGLDDQGFESWQGLRIFLFSTVSRTALGPTQPPIQWVPAALSLRVKLPRREADHSPPSSAEVKNAWSYTSTPPLRLHDVVLS